jgi:outer membrane protein insertion porin family
VTIDAQEIPGGIGVTFKVVEKPVVKKIDFKGNKKLSKGKLSDALTLKENDPLDKTKMNTDVEKMLSLYKDEGFAAAEVEPFTTTDATNHTTVTFYIKEGTQVLIQQVIVLGVKSFPEPKVRKLMKARKKKVFKQDQLVKDVEEMIHFYKTKGFLDVKVSDPLQTFNEDKTRLTITVTITEGPLLHFGATRFMGNAIFQENKLRPALVYKQGEIFNQDKMDATQAKLRDVYGDLGYIRTRIEPNFERNLSSGTVDINFQISEGEVVYVDHIGIEGNIHTKDYVIRREIQLKTGEAFSSVKARRSVERLYNLGFLDNVDIDVQQPNSPTQADVIFTVTEGKPGTLSAGAGYSSVDGLIGTLQIQHINFLGRGQRLNLQWQFGARVNSFDLGWQNPWFLGKPLTFGADIFNTIHQITRAGITNAYTTRDRGVSLTAGPRFSDIYNLLFTYTFADERLYNIDNTVFTSPNVYPNSDTRLALLGPQGASDAHNGERTILRSNITTQLIRDARDNQFDPTKGNRESIGVTYGGLFPAQAVHYYKPILDFSVHFPTFWKFVLSFHANYAVVKPFSNSNLSDIDPELFRTGGADTVRGYELGHVGYRNGAQIQNVYNVEYKFPIAPDEHGKTLLQGVLFYDIGGSWNRYGGIHYVTGPDQTNLKQGVGFGVRFKTPVFPLRLDFGIPLNRAPDDPPTQFYFNVGSLF